MEQFLKDNITQLSSKNNGWIIGHFADVSTPFYSKDFEVKWVKDSKGRIKENLNPQNNNQTTLVILLHGKLMFEALTENVTQIIDQEGDCILYKPTVPHRTTFLEDSHILVIRWPSLEK